MYKQLIEKKLMDYLIEQDYPHKKSGKLIMVQCPLCEREPFSASFIPNVDIVHCIPCNADTNIIDFVRAIEPDFENKSNEEIYTHLRQMFNLEVPTEQEETVNDKLLTFYAENEFCFVQLSKNCHDKKWSYGKTPWEKNWTDNENKDIYTCKEWIKSGLNIGVRTGAVSGITVIDIDAMPKVIKDKVYEGKATEVEVKEAIAQKEKILKEILTKLNVKLGETLYQETFGGVQLFYKYDKDLPKTRIKAISTDIETDGGQVVVEPSLVGGTSRKFIISPIIELPRALKQYLLKGIQNQRSSVSPSKPAAQKTESGGLTDQEFEQKNLNFGLVSKGDGRSNFLIKMGGAIRPFFNIVQTKRMIHILNKTLLSPPIPEVGVEQTVIKSIERYTKADELELSKAILEYLEKAKAARKDEIEVRILGGRAKGEDKERIDNALIYLITTDKILKKRNEYKIIEDMVWTDSLVNHMKPITSFKYPYFDSHAHFCWGDLLILGSQNKFGKCLKNSHLITNQGVMKIEDIGKDRPEGISKVTNHIRVCDATMKAKTYSHPEYFWKEKVNKTIKIITHYGYEIEGTPNHPIKIIKQGSGSRKMMFKQLKDLKIGDTPLIYAPEMFKRKKIKHAKKLKTEFHSSSINVKLDSEITPDLAKLMGYIIGDGHVEKNVIRIYQNVKDIKIILEICSLIKKLGLNPKLYQDKNCQVISICSVQFSKFIRLKAFEIRNNTTFNIKSPNRFIPNCILKSSKECQISFIAAIYNCESNLRIFKNKSAEMEICMASKEIINTLHILLLNFGIISRKTIRKVKTYPDNDYYRIIISSSMTYDFLKIFKPVKYKGIKIKNGRGISNIKTVGKNQFSDKCFYIDTIKTIDVNNKECYVYDFNMGDGRFQQEPQFWSNGFISHNTTLCMNFLKRFVDQGIKPYYIYNESGSRFVKAAWKLGLKDGDFFKVRCSDPEKIILKPNSVCIFDWVKPNKEDGFARLDILFERIVDKLEKTNSIMLCLVQLRGNNEFFAKDQIGQHPALLAKYVYEDEQGLLTKFQLIDVRDGKLKGKQFEIPCKYNWETKEVKTIEEIGRGGK